MMLATFFISGVGLIVGPDFLAMYGRLPWNSGALMLNFSGW